MEAAIRSTLEADGVPGAVLLVARNGEVLGHEAFGEADPLAGDPMTTDAQFRICSQTKAITSMAAMVLWERGLLGLDDPVSDTCRNSRHRRARHPAADSTRSTLPRADR